MDTIFESNFITMSRSQPRATHIAVRDGRILAVGGKKDIAAWQKAWGEMPINQDFAKQFICPGFIEGHSHLMEGLLWDYTYVGFYDRMGPDGVIHKGLKTIDEVLERLREAQKNVADKSAPVIAWGLDPIYFDRRMMAEDLDSVSDACPIIVLHASLHILNTNSMLIEKSGAEASNNPDILRRDAQGRITGEFLGQIGMFMAMRVAGVNLFGDSVAPQALSNFANVAKRAGVTTATDLANSLKDEEIVALKEMTQDPDYPLRLVIALHGNPLSAEDTVARMQEVQPQSTDKLRMSLIKLVADGSIQGFTARVAWPGYFNGAENGLWYIEPAILEEKLIAFTKAGLQTHIHTNGDETIEAALNAIENALRIAPWRDHRHTLQHCQMANRAHYKRMSQLGVGVNLFSNHIYYWGDAHINITMGSERAARIDDAGGALAENVPLAMHSDAPITALAPLFTAWCAVERKTSGGETLGGEAEAISPQEALEAITLGAAYSLKLDKELGSLEVGKWADFAILDKDPLAIAPAKIKDVKVLGTALAGKLFLNEK